MSAGTPRSPARRAEPEGNRDESAAWMHGAAEALSVLHQHGPAVRWHAARHAAGLLAQHAEPADWSAAGLPAPAAAQHCSAGEIPVSDPAVLSMARTAASLTASTLPGVEALRV